MFHGSQCELQLQVNLGIMYILLSLVGYFINVYRLKLFVSTMSLLIFCNGTLKIAALEYYMGSGGVRIIPLKKVIFDLITSEAMHMKDIYSVNMWCLNHRWV